MKTLHREKCWEEKLLYCIAINVKKVDNRRLENCVNLLTCKQVSHERTTEPFKETYGESF